MPAAAEPSTEQEVFLSDDLIAEIGTYVETMRCRLKNPLFWCHWERIQVKHDFFSFILQFKEYHWTPERFKALWQSTSTDQFTPAEPFDLNLLFAHGKGAENSHALKLVSKLCTEIFISKTQMTEKYTLEQLTRVREGQARAFVRETPSPRTTSGISFDDPGRYDSD